MSRELNMDVPDEREMVYDALTLIGVMSAVGYTAYTTGDIVKTLFGAGLLSYLGISVGTALVETIIKAFKGEVVNE